MLLCICRSQAMAFVRFTPLPPRRSPSFLFPSSDEVSVGNYDPGPRTTRAGLEVGPARVTMAGARGGGQRGPQPICIFTFTSTGRSQIQLVDPGPRVVRGHRGANIVSGVSGVSGGSAWPRKIGIHGARSGTARAGHDVRLTSLNMESPNVKASCMCRQSRVQTNGSYDRNGAICTQE